MTTSIVRHLMPEEEELARKRSKLAHVETLLVQRELDLATLRAELFMFNRRYLNVVGRRYAELDGLAAQIADLLARRNPGDIDTQARAVEARQQAKESEDEAAGAAEGAATTGFTPSESLRSLYRQVAKRFHPDLANNEQDRTRRHSFMTRANGAYELGDIARLQALLSEWDNSPELVAGEDIGSELIRLIRKIAQVRTRLHAIDTEMTQRNQSDLASLKRKVEDAERNGRDLLAEMAAKVGRQITEARETLDGFRKGGQQHER